VVPTIKVESADKEHSVVDELDVVVVPETMLSVTDKECGDAPELLPTTSIVVDSTTRSH
jgi:hypothetical protein